MATGVPNKDKKNLYTPVHLEYEGKQSTKDILLNINSPNFHQLQKGSKYKRLYFGENLDVLKHLLLDSSISGKVNLVYIDPPFATQNTYISRKNKEAYTDTFTSARFVEFLRTRLIFLREILSDRGSIYLHLDEKMVFEMKLVMDEIFGRRNYRNLIVRKKCNPKNYTRKAYGNISDFILFYSKTDNYVWNKPLEPLPTDSLKEYRHIEPETGRRFMKVPIHAPGTRKGKTGQPWRKMLPPPGKHWQYTPSKLDEMDSRGEIFWSKNGNPRRKVYLDNHLGMGIQDIWLDFKDAHNQNIKITGYPTEKNPNLLQRIIATSSNKNDIVLDCFVGSGTTIACADEMQRNWIGVDKSHEALDTIFSRFKYGLKPMGDYVKKEQHLSKLDNSQTLFSTLDARSPKEFKSQKKIENHKSLTNFMILAAENTVESIQQIVARWQY